MAWFICPYKRRIYPDTPVQWPERYCAMDDFTAQIRADGGTWSEAECLGDHAVIKVRASAAILTLIAAAPGFTRIPKDLLDETLADLSNAQRTAIVNKLESLGYTAQEIRDRLGVNISSRTLRDVLRFALTRRRKPRYDASTDTIILDGPVLACKPIEALDAEVS